MTYIILTRNPSTKRLCVGRSIGDDSEDPPLAEYETFDEALRVADNSPACVAWDFDIVEVFV